ncbi:hypothetical protein EZS27_034641 [termite gut metagenome]|uniref:DDE Tnp4 domain-containing protein n=1 Tax=termite gut metagenome TaxID=433724 RepID=A0A5J4Q1C6_9ZZZZ
MLLNGTERSIQRPLNADKQKSCYSGKKTHNLKNNPLCTPDKEIIWLSKTFEGHVHDKRIMDKQPLCLPTGITLWQDTGFLGHYPENVTVKMPMKKSKGKEVSLIQKQQNKEISSFRMKIEHAIGEVKIFRIVKERYCCHKLFFEDLVWEIACGLHKFKLSCLSI